MPIIHLTSTEEKALASGLNVKRIDCNNDGKCIMWTYETHHGLCVSDREMNGSWDSDWYMLVWNPETQEPFEIEFASTRGWTYPCYASRPDATPEIMAAYRAWHDAKCERARLAEEERRAKTPDRGKVVRVVRGRKVPIGTQGLCTWIGASKFGVRVGIDTAQGRVFTAVANVEVVAQ